MSTDTDNVIALHEVTLEISVIWGRKRISVRDLQVLCSTPDASVDFNQAMSEHLELMVGDTCIGRARIVQDEPVRLELVELTER